MTLRIMAEDGTLHFGDAKKLGGPTPSPRQYLQAVNTPTKPTSAMLVGTAAHFLTLGARPGAKPLVVYDADRRGKAWTEFRDAHPDAEILTAKEWALAEAIAESVREDPVAQARLAGARFEVPLTWEDSGFRCSTSGIDIVSGASIADLKTTTTVEPEAWKRQALKMSYHVQMGWYRRACLANGIDVSKGCYLLGVETKAPFEVVELEMTEDLVEMADRTITLWLERLRACVLTCPVPTKVTDWPGYEIGRAHV